mmetsp:Transcript_34433/g.35027  ORF Transcript_34433/g.35027 Transcript_34433/m.35027 type:complete len:92 (-) Transcript_34433:321-596(-)
MNCSWSNCSAAIGMLLLRTAAGLLAGENAVATEALYTALMAKRVNFMVAVNFFSISNKKGIQILCRKRFYQKDLSYFYYVENERLWNIAEF